MPRAVSSFTSASSPGMRRPSSSLITTAATFLPTKREPYASGVFHVERKTGLSANSVAAAIVADRERQQKPTSHHLPGASSASAVFQYACCPT